MKRVIIADVMVGSRWICTVWVPEGYDIRRYIERLHPSLRRKNWRIE